MVLPGVSIDLVLLFLWITSGYNTIRPTPHDTCCIQRLTFSADSLSGFKRAPRKKPVYWQEQDVQLVSR
jgi:hypothetical protein